MINQEFIRRRSKKPVIERQRWTVFRLVTRVLKWDALKEKKGNHGKFDALWTGPLVIAQVQMNNTFILHNLEGEGVFDGPVNG